MISPSAGAAGRQHPLGVATTPCAQLDWSGSRPRGLYPAPLIPGCLRVARSFRWIWAYLTHMATSLRWIQANAVPFLSRTADDLKSTIHSITKEDYRLTNGTEFDKFNVRYKVSSRLLFDMKTNVKPQLTSLSVTIVSHVPTSSLGYACLPEDSEKIHHLQHT